MVNKQYSTKEAMVFSQRIAQLSKAMWKVVETDWQKRIKPFDLNINEHHILLIAEQLQGASISDISKYGVMHVSTAFNFSKKLEERGLLRFSKKENDKRNTYIELTEKGNELLVMTIEAYNPEEDKIHAASLTLKKMFGKYPEFSEVQAIIRNIYGEDFMKEYELPLKNRQSI